MYHLTKYTNNNNQKVVYCQFCKNFYYQNVFVKHLQLCNNYLKFIDSNRKTIRWKPHYDKIVSFNRNPQSFSNLIKNQRVIIVGPSITVQECNLGNFINSFDVIIRLNKSLPVPRKMHPHIGNRTDILYNSLNTSDYPGENRFSPHFLKKQKVKYLRCPYPPISPFTNDIKSFYRKSNKIIDFGHIDTTYYGKLEYCLGTRPYTGTCAIADLLHSGVKELFVMGIDFYTYKHSFYYRNVSERKLAKLRNNNIHRRRPQINLIRRFYLLDTRLIVDNILDEILLEKYDSLYYGIKSHIHFGKVFVNGFGDYLTENKFLEKKICIVGDIGEFEKVGYPDMIIDLFPERENEIHHKNITEVYRNILSFSNLFHNDSVFPEFGEEEFVYDKNVIFTQMLSDEVSGAFRTENCSFINPLFAQYLKSILTKTIFSKGSLSLEMFIILVFSVFFEEVYISNINPNHNWTQQSSGEKQHYIEQRMLFQYLLKREKIKYL